MKDLRGPLPLTDADFTRIRANVMASVRPRRTMFAFRWAFAMLAAAFVGVVSYKSLQDPTVAVPMTATTTTKEVPVIHVPTPPVAIATQIEIPQPTQPPPRRAQSRAVKPRAEASAPAPQLRMEILTTDPDIRIIWLPNQTPKSEEES